MGRVRTQDFNGIGISVPLCARLSVRFPKIGRRRRRMTRGMCGADWNRKAKAVPTLGEAKISVRAAEAWPEITYPVDLVGSGKMRERGICRER